MEQRELFAWLPEPTRVRETRGASEWKIVPLRETAYRKMPECSSPREALEYWKRYIATAGNFNPDVESLVALALNTRMRVRGHYLVSIGGLNEAIAHPREVFRAAVIGAAYAIVLMHNHPSGDPTPSEVDRRITRRFVEVGELLQIKLQDHVIVGDQENPYFSFREDGML